MAEAFYGKQLHDGSWAMAAIIKVCAIPDTMSPKVLSDLITDCNDMSSVELLAVSGSEKGETGICLLLRLKGYSPSQLQQHMEKSVQTMLSRLKYEGFDAVLLPQKDAETFVTAPGAGKQRMLCVPGENMRGIRFCYCPGGYSATRALDLPYLFTLLSESSGAGLSFQLRRETYTQEELESLDANRNWVLANFGNLQEGKAAAEVFGAFLGRKNVPFFFTTLSAWGDPETLGNLASSIRRSGYELLSVSEDLFFGLDYLGYGESVMASYAQSFGHVLENDQPLPVGLERMNYLAVEKEIQYVFQQAFPAKNLSGVKIRRGSADEDFVPAQFLDGYGLKIGRSLSLDQDISLPLSQLTKHIVVAGMPGSGKTTLLFHILHELSERSIPFLAIEPTKTEYRELVDVIPDLKVLTPGRTDVNPIMFNPFLPPKGVTLEQFLPSLTSAFQMAFSMTTPLDVIFPEVLRTCYAEYGWRNDSTSDSPEAKVFGMNEFICAFKEEISASDYDPESKQNLNSGGGFRLQSLINTNPYLFDTDRSFPVERLLKGHTVIELDAIDNPEHKALFLALLLLQLKLVIRENQIKDSKLKNVILIDEAHILLDAHSGAALKNEADPSGKLREYLLDMVKVNRAFGTGMVFADQSLAVLKDYVNNSNVKMIMHVESAAEREFVTRNLNLTMQQYERIKGLKTGEYYLYCEEVEQPFIVKAPDTRSELSLSSDVDDKKLHEKMAPVYEKPFAACKCKKSCSIEIRTEAEFIARSLLAKIRPLLHDSEALNNYMKLGLDDAIAQMTEDSDQEKRLARCARMMVERMVQTRTSL